MMLGFAISAITVVHMCVQHASMNKHIINYAYEYCWIPALIDPISNYCLDILLGTEQFIISAEEIRYRQWISLHFYPCGAMNIGR